MKKNYLLSLLTFTLFSIQHVEAQDAYIGEIRMFAGNFAPTGWQFCNGQLLSIAQNTTLFSLLGTTYGGNGTQTFGLPDLRGRVPVHAGFSQGPGLTPVDLGQVGGTENTSILISNLPAHTHSISANTSAGTTSIPTNAINADSSTLDKEYTTNAANTTMSPTGSTGGSLPINNMQPYLGINFIIATQGIYPTRP